MKQSDTMRNETTGSLLVVPQAFLESLAEGQNKIIALLESSLNKNQIGDYITEPEAQKMLGRKATWFWGMRTKGLLAFAKVGSKVFYSRRDIEKLFEDHKRNL